MESRDGMMFLMIPLVLLNFVLHFLFKIERWGLNHTTKKIRMKICESFIKNKKHVDIERRVVEFY